MKKSYKDYFPDSDERALRCDTIAFLMAERIKVRDALIEAINECDGDDFTLAVQFPELYQEAARLDKRIMAELEALAE
jgi:hypothetical protein